MVALAWIINIILILACIALVAFVLMQDSKSGGMGEAFGGGAADSFYAKNKSKGKDARLALYTKVLAIGIAILSVIMVLIVNSITA